jgi:hypothetical protein
VAVEEDVVFDLEAAQPILEVGQILVVSRFVLR